MKKEYPLSVLLSGDDLFSDGLLIIQQKPDSDEFFGLMKKYKKITKDIKQTYEDNCNGCNGFTIGIEDGKFIIILFSTAEIGTMEHEMLHAVELLLEHRNIPSTKDTEELRCMLLAKMVRQVHGAKIFKA